VLLVALFGSVALGFSDGVAAIASIVSVAIYYAGLYLTRKIFERKIEFTIFNHISIAISVQRISDIVDRTPTVKCGWQN
jgi:hypothetical protein